MEVEYILTEDDIVAMARYQANRALKAGNWTIPGWILMAFFFLMSLLFVVSQPDEFYAYIPALFIAGLSIYIFLVPWIVVRNTKRLLHQGNYAKVLGRHRLLITQEALIQDSEYGTGRTLWAGVDRIDTTKDHAFIFFAGNTALMIPGRAFANKDDFDEFVSTAKRFRKGAIEQGD